VQRESGVAEQMSVILQTTIWQNTLALDTLDDFEQPTHE
jgi:hypothetical protein